jgi:hypothetical protein
MDRIMRHDGKSVPSYDEVENFHALVTVITEQFTTDRGDEVVHPTLIPTNMDSSAGIFTGTTSKTNADLENKNPGTIMTCAR